MVQVITNLENFDSLSCLRGILSQFSNKFILDNGVYYSETIPNCPCCGNKMIRNGHNVRVKKGIISLKIGKYHCNGCNKNIQEPTEFYDELIRYIQEQIVPILATIRAEKVAYRGIENIMKFFVPIGKDTAYKLIEEYIESAKLPEFESKGIQVIGYDEQIAFTNGVKRVRILIFDIITGFPILEILEDSKISEVIKSAFIKSKIDFSKITIIVTDLDKSYPKILDELFGENLYHQPCLFHLMQLICKTFPKNCSIFEETMKYTLLNVFYDHEEEIRWLEVKTEDENLFLESNSKKQYKIWLKDTKKEFRLFCKGLKQKQRIEGIESMIREFDEIMNLFLDILKNIERYPVLLQKRIQMIDKHFVKFTTFCESKLIPTTNNGCENYFFRTLNMGWKKRMRTDKGLMNHLKLQCMRITNYFENQVGNIIQFFCKLYSLHILA